MAGILDILDAPKDSLFGMLNMPASQGFGDVPKDKDADAKALWDKLQAETEKQNADADRRNAAGLAASSGIAPSAPSFGAPDASSPAIAMALGRPPATPFGSLAPTAPQAPQPTPAAAQTPVPLPQPRPSIPVPSQALPAPVANAQASVPVDQTTTPAAPSAAPQGPSVLDKIGNALGNNSNLLLGLGAGFAGAPSIGTGISRGLTGASAGGQLDLKQQLQQGAIGPTYKALVSAGVPKEQALAAVYNPTILKSVTENYLGDRKGEVKMVKDEFGAEHPMIFDPYTKTLKPISPLGGSGDTNASPTGSSFLAPGVTSVDQSKTGDEYLNQYSPAVQAAVHDYHEGKAMPTGNPRGGYATQIAAIAKKYGQDVGMPVDDTLFSQRKTMRNDLGKDSPSSLGGQITTGEHASDILARMGKAAEDLRNVDVGLAGPSHVINDVRGMTSSQAAKMQALQTEAQHYGQEITKFYSGSPGGEAERNRFMSSIGAAKTPQELASVLEHESELLHDRMTSIEGHIKGTLGEKGLAEHPVIREPAQKSFGAVAGSVARLRGEQSAQPAQTAAVPTATGPDGHKIVVQNGRWVDAQTGKPVQ